MRKSCPIVDGKLERFNQLCTDLHCLLVERRKQVELLTPAFSQSMYFAGKYFRMELIQICSFPKCSIKEQLGTGTLSTLVDSILSEEVGTLEIFDDLELQIFEELIKIYNAFERVKNHPPKINNRRIAFLFARNCS